MDAAEMALRLGKIRTPSTAHMSVDERTAGVEQMLADLEQLARRDGCIAAAWALEVISLLPTDEERLALAALRAGVWVVPTDAGEWAAETVDAMYLGVTAIKALAKAASAEGLGLEE